MESLKMLIPKLDNEEKCIKYLQEVGILQLKRKCANGHSMKLVFGGGNKNRWRCSKRNCRKEKGVRTDNWLASSRLPYGDLIRFIFSWSCGLASAKYCKSELGMKKDIITDWNRYMGEVCLWKLLRNPVTIGGPDKHVEIDKVYFAKRKNHVGRVLPQQWVFGGICIETKEVFMVSVTDDTQSTVIPLIIDYIHPETIIFTEDWSAFRAIQDESPEEISESQHLILEAGYNFVDPCSKDHTKHIELLWHPTKAKNKRKKLAGYFAEFLWRHSSLATHSGNMFNVILSDMVSFRPPTD